MSHSSVKVFLDDEFLYEYGQEKQHMYGSILVSLEVAFPIIALFLHFTDVIHLPKVLTVGHILIALALVYIMLMSIKQVIRREVIHKEMLAGTVVLVATGLVEKKNRERDEIKIVYASGFAQKGEELTDDLHTGNEEGRVFQEVYKLADKRMYENKALIKQGKA